jgi:hypothetical protein
MKVYASVSATPWLVHLRMYVSFARKERQGTYCHRRSSSSPRGKVVSEQAASPPSSSLPAPLRTAISSLQYVAGSEESVPGGPEMEGRRSGRRDEPTVWLAAVEVKARVERTGVLKLVGGGWRGSAMAAAVRGQGTREGRDFVDFLEESNRYDVVLAIAGAVQG